LLKKDTFEARINLKKLIMKNIAIKAISLVVITLGMVSCKNNKAKTSEAKEVEKIIAEETFKAVPAQTMISWDAKKIVGGHNGTINASTGVLNVKDGKLVGGNFIFDVNTIKCLDIPADDENNAKLVGHLKGEDFFNVAKYPNAAFQITSVSEENGKQVIAGNLTVKGIKKNIKFPATVSINGNSATITSEEFAIDRTEFDIKYNSGKFADAAKLGDYLIKDNVGVKVTVTATK